MVNMNKFKDPCIYGLTAPGVGVFYVGYTSVNAKNRWWQHISRARSGHQSPVYRKMRELGVDSVGYEVLERVTNERDAFSIEARWIKKLFDDGVKLSNMIGADGSPHSLPEALRRTMGLSRRGLPTWIKGKSGPEAGWTEERKVAQAQTMARKRAQREIANPELLWARMEKEETNIIRSALSETGIEIKFIARHGTRTMYEKHGCKCDKCRNCMAQHNARKRGNPNWQSVVAKPLKSSQ